MSDPKNAGPGDPLEERILRRIPLEIAALSALLAIPVALFLGLIEGALFLGGGLLAAISFLWLKSALGRVVGTGGAAAGPGSGAVPGAETKAPAKSRAIRSGIAVYALRMALILAVFSLIMLAYPRKILAFAAGFSTILPVFIVEAVATLARVKSETSWKV